MGKTGEKMVPSFDQQLFGSYAGLSDKLKQAADFVVAHPVDVASRSLRSVSREANLSPATFSRMSAAIGYASYDDLRAALRQTIAARDTAFSAGVETLQQKHDAGDHMFHHRHVLSCSTNLSQMLDKLDASVLERCVEHFHSARRVHVLGALGSTGVAEHMTYMASMIADNWSLVGRHGASVASSLVGLSAQDVVVIITKPPFAVRSIQAAKLAAENQAFVVVITDTHTCPALTFASASFIVPTGSPHFFSSFASTLVLSEILIGMLAARAGEPVRERIEAVETQNRLLDEVWDG